jgi:hypothetical protein
MVDSVRPSVTDVVGVGIMGMLVFMLGARHA